MKRRNRYFVGLICLVIFAFFSGCGIRPEENLFLHYTSARTVASIEVVQVKEFEQGSAIEHEILCPVSDIKALVDDIIELDVVGRDGRFGIRENTMVFKITYVDGCVAFFDAAGSSYELGEDCLGIFTGEWKYVYAGSRFMYDENQFAALIQKYLDAAASVEESADT